MENKSERLTMSIVEFAEATGCSKNLAFRLARQNRLPVQTIFIGEKRMCVSRRAVENMLLPAEPQSQFYEGTPRE